MKWAHSIKQKFKAAILLAVVCVAVLITNLLSRHQMGELSDSFSSVYEDRLVVESYIYKLSEHLYQKKLALDDYSETDCKEVTASVNSHNEAIHELLVLYEKTLLTDDEVKYLTDFKANVLDLEQFENQYLNLPVNETESAIAYNLINTSFDQASYDLRQLSNIQIKEGKLLNDQSQRIVQGSSVITSFEMVLLICIAVALQIIVLASRPAISPIWQNGHLN